MADTIYYPDYNKPELILSFDTIRLENLPRSRPGRNNQSRVETPGGAAIVQSLGPRVQYLQWNIRNMDNTDKTTLYNFFNDTVEWSLYTFDYVDSQGNMFHGCRYWQDEDDFQQANYTNRFTENITIRVNAVQHIYAGSNANGKIFRSSDGTTWTEMEDTTETTIYSMFAWKGYLYAGTGLDGSIIRSLDGDNWTEVYNDSSDVYILCFGVFNNYIYAGTGNADGKILRSSDGVNWSTVFDDSPTKHVDDFAVFNGKIYAATGNDGIILSSSNGTDWNTAYDSSSQVGFVSLFTDGTNIYAGGSLGGVILKSSDGTNWTEVYDDSGEVFILDIKEFNGYLYATTGVSTGRILRSSDGSTWSIVYDESKEDIIYDLCVFENYIYAGTGSNGTILRSSDGTTWTEVYDDSVETFFRSFAVFTF